MKEEDKEEQREDNEGGREGGTIWKKGVQPGGDDPQTSGSAGVCVSPGPGPGPGPGQNMCDMIKH